MIELAASTALRALETALGANGIQVPDEAIQQFLDGLSFAYFSSLLVSGLIFS